VAILRFEGDNAFLSNFWPCPSGIEMDGELYSTVEHAFQAAKTRSYALRLHVRCAATPAEAKRRGRKLVLRTGWDGMRVLVMRELIRKKFLDPALRAGLLATGTRHLVEGNDWGDAFWGKIDNGKGAGSNWLGRILMEERAEIRREATLVPQG
jgi:ribA/ribD-fused uncharacterized protein